jgi:hypothetical protein
VFDYLLAQMADRERKELENIRLQLSAFKLTSQLQDPPVDNLRGITERIIQNFVKISFDTAVNTVTIQEQLKELHEDNLISTQQYTRALQEVEKVGTTQADVPSISKSVATIILLCHSLYYHFTSRIPTSFWFSDPYISVHPLSGKILGDGPHGKVLLVVDKNGVKHAAKCFQRSHSKEFTSEFGLLALVRHKNIVRYIGLARLHSYENPAVVMELMNTDLHKRILQHPSIELSNKFYVLRDIAEGLDYLHTYQPKIIHRDLTAKNVLLSSSGIAKIADFGNSRMVNQEQLTEMTSVAGTLVYLAPEAQGNEYNEKIDIFSYGHLMLFIFIDEFPSDLSSPSYFVLDPNKPSTPVPRVQLETDRRRKYLEKLLHRGTSVVKLVEKCLSNIPADRPAASQLVEFHKHYCD